jgi:uncharacterized protein (DUF1015 family)
MRIDPYKAWRPAPGRAAEVASVPYDTVDADEARQLAAGKPWSFLHVSRAEIDLAPGIDPHAPEVYRKAAENLDRFRASGVLRMEPSPSLHVYRQTMGRHTQRGIVACCHVGDYETNVIKRHENTLEAKEIDRTLLQKALQVNSGPVFLTYRDRAEIDAIVAEAERAEPLFDFQAENGVGHAGWRIADPAALVRAFAAAPSAYIADGHHRAAASVRMARDCRAANPKHTGQERYNWFLGVLFPASQLQVLPYNRIVADLNGLSVEAFLRAVRERFRVSTSAPVAPGGSRRVSLYVGGAWYGLSWDADPAGDAVSELDVSVLQDRLLGPVLGIDDPRRNPRIRFVGGIRGTDVLGRAVDAQGGAAFSMAPVTVEQIMAVADTGRIMPPKSTWFEPKLRSGLFLHDLRG